MKREEEVWWREPSRRGDIENHFRREVGGLGMGPSGEREEGWKRRGESLQKSLFADDCVHDCVSDRKLTIKLGLINEFSKITAYI